MIKTPSLFVRANGIITEPVTVTPGCEWVLQREGQASRKRDGLAIKIDGGHVLKRFDCKNGKTPPPGFEPCQVPDPVTGHWPGWVPCLMPNDRVIFEALAYSRGKQDVPNGTYEVCGPRVGTRSGGNPEGLSQDQIFKHGSELVVVERTYGGILTFLKACKMEGLVFYRPDGQYCKVKSRDYGVKWP